MQSVREYFQMAAYKSGAFVRSKYILYPVLENACILWIPRSKSGASKSRPLWAAHTRIGNVWEYPPPPPAPGTANGRPPMPGNLI